MGVTFKEVFSMDKLKEMMESLFIQTDHLKEDR